MTQAAIRAPRSTPPNLTDLSSGAFDLSGPINPGPAAEHADRDSRIPKPVAAVLRIPRVGTWSGLLVIAAGLVLITIAWGDTAATENVGDQLPYVMSAGFTGLALVCIGATLAAIDAKLSDAKARRNQALELRDALADLRAVDLHDLHELGVEL